MMDTNSALNLSVQEHYTIRIKTKFGRAIAYFYGDLYLNAKDGFFDLVDATNRTVFTFHENDVVYNSNTGIFELKE